VTRTSTLSGALNTRVRGRVHHEHLADELAVAHVGCPVVGGLQQLGADTTALPAVDDLDRELPAPVAEVDDPHDADRTALGEDRQRNVCLTVQPGQTAPGGRRELGDRGLEAQVRLGGDSPAKTTSTTSPSPGPSSRMGAGS
jgi:hypothetical protein